MNVSEKIKDYVFDASWQYFDTHKFISREKFIDFWDDAIRIFVGEKK